MCFLLKRYFRVLVAILGLLILPLSAKADVLSTVDSLFTLYQQAPDDQKYDRALPLIDIFKKNDAFHEPIPALNSRLPADSINLYVWFGVECFYYDNAYFAESTGYSAKALPLAKDRHPNLYASLLCDHGYTLFKTGRSQEAIQTERTAVEASKRAGNLLQLSRAYLYLAIVNLSLNQTDDAKWFVKKAIETNDKLGLNANTHNTLGIACEIYSIAGEPAQAIEYGEKAVEAARAIGFDAGVANHLSQMSYSYNRLDSFELGLKMAQQAIDIVEAMDVPDRNLLALCLEYKAYNLNDMHRYKEGVEHLQRAIAIQEAMGNVRSVCNDLKELHRALLPIDSAAAMAALQRYSRLHDSVYYAELNHEIGQANAELHNAELADENSRKHRTNRMLLGGIAFLLVVIGVLAYLIRCSGRHSKTQHDRILHLLEQLEQYQKETPPLPEPDGEPEGQEAPQDGKNQVKDDFLVQVNDVILRLMSHGGADIAHVSSELCMTPSKFRRRINEYTGLTPANYILSIRMNEAKRMLALYPTYTMSDIAERCGFSDQSHFTHAFSRLFGVTPLQYAKGN